MTGTPLVLLIVASIIVLILLITKFKMNAFISLLLVSIGLSLALGNSGADTVTLITNGFGSVMAACGIVIVCGVIIGYFLEQSGGAEKIAASVIRLVGEKRTILAMSITGSIVSIPVFSDSALMILYPIAKNLSRKGKIPLLPLVGALTCCLCLTHSLVPPTPGPVAAAALLGADLGKVILYGIIVAIPCTLGIYFVANSKYFRNKWPDYVTDEDIDAPAAVDEAGLFKPGIVEAKGYSTFAAYMPIVIPILLIVVQSFSSQFIPAEHVVNRIFGLIGKPMIALLIGIGIVWFITREYRTAVKATWLEKAMDSTALILLITSAGGAYGAVIKSTAIGEVISTALITIGLPSVVLPWFIAAALATATGSATVAITTSAAICATFLSTIGLSPELTAVSASAGATMIIHVNSSGFWLPQRLTRCSVSDLLKILPTLSSVCGIVGLLAVFVLSLFVA